MVDKKSTDFLPQVFRTNTNRRFLNATVDQLIQEPNLDKIYGYIGRQDLSPAYRKSDAYVQEIDSYGQYYQLEPGLVINSRTTGTNKFEKKNAYGYVDLLNGIALAGGINTNHNKLFANEYYNYEGFVEHDKLINYGKYYWLPSGPKTLSVTGKGVKIHRDFIVSRPLNIVKTNSLISKNIGVPSYSFNEYEGQSNPDITLVRGGVYSFNISQNGNPFWIQIEPGINPSSAKQDNINKRDVFGVDNNGTDSGVLTFRVPKRDAQSILQFMNKFETVDFVTDIPFSQLQNANLADFLNRSGLDGVKSFNTNLIVLVDDDKNNWWDPRDESIIPDNQRKGIWRISVDGTRIRLNYVKDWPTNTKIFVNQGREYGNLNIVKTAAGKIIKEPNITTELDTFYYQDGVDVNVFGKIFIIDEDPSLTTINIADITGQKEYTSPNGIVFTNGLKVKFEGNVIPSSYVNKDYVVEGVGKSIKLVPWVNLVTPDPNNPNIAEGFSTNNENYDENSFGATLNAPIKKDYVVINRSSLDGNAWSRTNRWFHEDVISYSITFDNPNAEVILDNNNRANRPIIEFDPNLQLWNYGTTFVSAVAAVDIYTTDIANQVEGFSPYILKDAEGNYYSDNMLLIEGTRVVFINEKYDNVKNKIYEVQNINPYTPVILTKNTVNFTINNSTTLNFSSVSNLLINMAVTGKNIPDNTVIVSIDNKKNSVTLNKSIVDDISVNTVITFNSDVQQVHLSPIHTMSQGEIVVAMTGQDRQNLSYWWNNGSWQLSQQKNSLNQAPHYDVFNLDGISLGDKSFYSSSTFEGSKLFGYKIGAGTADTELGFPLSYKNIGNIGDIVFENYYDSDQFHFNYNNTDQVLNVSIGYAHEIIESDLSFILRNNWVKITDLSKQYIETKIEVSANKTNNFLIDVEFVNSFSEKNIFVYVNSVEIDRQNFELYGNSKVSEISFTNDLKANDTILIRIFGNTSNNKETFTLPKNLVDNSINDVFVDLTLGQIRNHVQEMASNSLDFKGNAIGNNNLRDIEYKLVPGKILQHSSGVHVAQLMFNNETTNIIKAIDFNRRSYSRFKDRFLHLVNTVEFVDSSNARNCLDLIMEEITINNSNEQSFYYTDMVPYGLNSYTVNHYEVFDTKYRTFNLINQFDVNTPYYNAVLVYLNNVQIVNNIDYTMDGNIVVLDSKLDIGINDVVSVYEYDNTKGCMIPATPTKLGLYPKFTPHLYTDNTYLDIPVDMIQGHDGSKTLAFGDYRDDIVLEFEKRIYNNIYVDFSNDARTCFTGIEPGAFRNTDYSIEEWTQLLSSSFLSWAGANNVNIFENLVSPSDPFSYNYSNSTDKVFHENLPGYWRGIFKYFYDTDRPHSHPWEMLGFTQKPTWWELRYGPAPYSAGNAVLWNDLENGVIYNHGRDSYIDVRYARPGLSGILPVDDHGDLLAPTTSIIGSFDPAGISMFWRFGDQSPQETAWRRSSDYPFAVQTAWALARPAQYATLSLNRRDLVRIPSLDQIINLRASNRKLNLLITDETQYIPGTNIWIRDRLTDLSLDVTTNFEEIFQNFSLNLIYKLSGYTDKSYLNVIADQSTPSSNNSGFSIPQENYNVIFTKSAPIGSATYSAIIIEKIGLTYSVYGFDTEKPYFTIIPRNYEGDSYSMTVSQSSAKIYTEDSTSIQVIPYGTQFAQRQQVVDFLVSYGRYLNNLGFQFQDLGDDLSPATDWSAAVREFLFLLEQGWIDNNNVISLTPAGTRISFDSGFGVVDNIIDSFNDSQIINSNGKVLQRKEYTTQRVGTKFIAELKDKSKGIHLLKINVVQYEHSIVFDNTSVFNDVIYQPSLGNRQNRLKIDGYRTREWDGSLYAPGFLINHLSIDTWMPMQDYYKGDIVDYKNKNYTAKQFIPGSGKFNESDWYVVNSKILDRQMIMNLASGSEQIEHFYDVDEFDVNRSADMSARNSTGFTPRSYMTDLGLDYVSQHKFYLGMIREKGTQAAINAFMRAKLPYLDNGIEVKEQWAIRLGDYGGIDTKVDIEVSLDNVKPYNGGYIVELIENNHALQGLGNSFAPKDLLIRPPFYKTNIFESNIPNPFVVATAGPVLITDVDATVFDIQKIQNINDVGMDLGEGSRIWIASDKKNEWNVLRVTADSDITIISVTVVGDELEFITNKAHELSVNENILIQNGIVSKIDISGFFRVNSVNGKTFRVPVNSGMLTANGKMSAKLNKLKSIRYNHKGRFALNSPGRGWVEKDTVWVDGLTGNWETITNTSKWTLEQSLTPVFAKESDNFGNGVDVKSNQDMMIVGAPSKGLGCVYLYRQNSDNTWSVIEGVTPDDKYASEFGYSVKFSDGDSAVVGAPSSYNSTGLVYVMTTTSEEVGIHQILNVENLPVDSRFGHSVSISKNGKWIAVGAPGNNTVYMFKHNKVSKPSSVTYSTYGSSRFQVPFNTLNLDLTSNDYRVYLNYKLLVPFIDYKVENKSVVLKSTVTNKVVNDGIILQLDANHDIYPGLGVNWNDSSPSKNNATLVGNPVYHSTESNGIFTFNGTNQYASINTSLLNTTYTGKTVFVVCRMSSGGWTPGVQQYRAMFGNNNNIDTSHRNFNFYVKHQIDNTYVLHFSTAGSHTMSAVVQIVPDTWMVLAVTQDETTTRYYVNGVQVDVRTGTTLNQYVDGGVEAVGKADHYWAGDIASCLIYSRALTAAEIHKNYNIFATRVGLQPLIIATDRENNENDILTIVYDTGYVFIDATITNAVPRTIGTVFRLINNVVSTIYINLGWDNLSYDEFSWDHDDKLGNFGSSVSLSADGAQLLVGAPNLSPTIQERKDTIFEENETQFEDYETFFVGYVNKEYQKMGAAYVYNLDTEIFIPNEDTNVFPLDNLPVLPTAYVDGVENKNFFVSNDPENSVLVFNKPVHIDSIVAVETNVYDLLEIKLTPTHTNNLLFGSKVLICPNTCSLYIGAVGYNAIGKGNGAVYRYVNAARTYGSISAQVANPRVKIGENIRLNGVRVDFTGTTIEDVVNDINNTAIPGISASITFNTTHTHKYLLIKSDSELAYNRLNLGLRHKLSSYVDLGLNVFDLFQTILSPMNQDTANFGNQITLNTKGDRVLIGANRASSRSENTFDGSNTTFDLHSTKFNAVYYRSGSAYLYEYQGDIAENSIDHGNFAYAQSFSAPALETDDFFSSGVSLTDNWAIVTALNSRNGAGTVYGYYNPTGKPNWETVRHKLPATDSRNIERIYLYNDNTKLLIADLPVIDPEHGMPVPNAAEQIEYIVNYDPAVYTNTPNGYSFATDPRHAWAEEHVGKLWWDTNQIKYNQWNQGDVLTRYNNWGVSFPNSYISVYEWIESDTAPSMYSGTASPLYTVSEVYTKKIVIDKLSGLPVTKFYFWIANSTTNSAKLKRQTAVELQDLINNPRNINDPFAAVIGVNALALYNCQDIINKDVRLHISLKNVEYSNPLHSEWGMFDDGSDLGIATEFLDRMNDSMSGQDEQGRVVPDEKLSVKQRYGISIRPRQTTFMDKFDARKTWITNVNSVMSSYPMVLLRDISPLFDFDPVPPGMSGSDVGFDSTAFNAFGWDIELNDFVSLKVDNDSELDYLNKQLYFIGQEVIVVNDSTSHGWSVRTLDVDPADANNTIWKIVSVKKYDLRDYWSYADWYAPQYSADTPITHTLNYEYEISSITPQLGDIIKIKNSSNGNWKLTVVREDFIELVGQQNATIQFKNNLYEIVTTGFSLDGQSIEIASFAKDCAIEFRKIFNIVNYNLLVKELRTEYKNIINVMIDKIATQFKQNDWILKTSFIDIKHRVRSLDQIPMYVKQPESVLTDFISEIKPYHTKVKTYVSSYDKVDTTALDLVDFDLPAYYNNQYNTYRQPQLGNYDDTSAIGNMGSILRINVTNTGIGYYNSVEVVITGDGKDAYATAKNEFGKITSIEVNNGGHGYTYATIKIVGTGNGAAATAIFGEIAAKPIYNAWLNNHTYGIEYIDVFDGGEGYDENTTAVIEGDGVGATAIVYTQDGKVSSVVVTNSGYGYTNAMSYRNGIPIGIKIIGAGTGAKAYAKLSNSLPRTFNNTIKFDRTTYKSMTKEWTANTVYDINDVITHNNKVYRLITDNNTGNNVTSFTTAKNFVTSNLVELDIKLWEPNQSYRKNTIVLHQLETYVALVDFTSNRDFEANTNMSVTNSIDWEPTTSYTANTVINYNNTVYIALVDFISPVIFTDAHLLKINPLAKYKGGYLSDAASRIWSYYNPSSGMPGKDLSQLMTGISYPGVNVKGSDFDQHAGFGVGVYEQNGYDLKTVNNDGIETIYGKQAIDTTLTSLYTDTQLGLRPEDMITTGGAYIDTYSGYAPEELIPGHMFDSLSLRVRTQANLNTIGTPEIVVVAFYSDGFTKRFSFDPKITGTPLPVGGVQNLIVYDDMVNYGIRYEGIDYTVNWANQYVEFTNYPSSASTIIINLIGNSGKNLIAEENFLGDGSTVEFKITDAPFNIQQAYVRINTVTVTDWILLSSVSQIRDGFSENISFADWAPATFYPVGSYVIYNSIKYRVIVEHNSNAEFIKANFTDGLEVVIRFDTAPASGSKIEVHLFDFPVGQKAYSEVVTEIHTVPNNYVYNTSGYTVTLPETVNFSLPYEPNIVVIINGLELEPSNQNYYVGDNITKEFAIASTRVIRNSQNIKDSDITVLLDGVKVYPYVHYTVNIGETNPVVTFIDAPVEKTEIVISNRFNATFIVNSNNSIVIKPAVRLRAGDKIAIRMFSTHDQYNMRTQVFSGSLTVPTTIPTYTLSRPVTNLNNLRVTINGNWIEPFYNFNLISPTKLRISSGYNPTGMSISDTIVVTHIDDNIRMHDIEFKIFKGIDEKFEYIGIGSSTKTRLTEDLLLSDSWLYLEDISVLSKPDASRSKSGVLFVNGERITFFIYDEVNKRVGQLRRATNGTGAGAVYKAGSVIHDGGLQSTVPNIVEEYIKVDRETTIVGKTGAAKTIDTNGIFRQGKLWIDQGESSPATGEGIVKSNTTQVKFLKALR